MIRSYRQFSGQNLGRLAALSDGIFAVAMTLLILNVHVPTASSAHTQQLLWAGDALRSEASLWNALVPLAPQLLTYFMSFLTLGIFWAAQQTQLNHFTQRSPADLDSPHLPARRRPDAFLNRSTGRIHHLPVGDACLLDQPPPSRSASLRQSQVCGACWTAVQRGDEGCDRRERKADRRISVALRGRVGAERHQHLSRIACLILFQLSSVIVPRIGPLNRI